MKVVLSKIYSVKNSFILHFRCIISQLSLAIITSQQHLRILLCQDIPFVGQSLQRLTSKEGREGLVAFDCQSPPVYNHLFA